VPEHAQRALEGLPDPEPIVSPATSHGAVVETSPGCAANHVRNADAGCADRRDNGAIAPFRRTILQSWARIQVALLRDRRARDHGRSGSRQTKTREFIGQRSIASS
jgi:hypothetical protein